jgi:UDP-4-amino-4-deoxy-L-arabinose formyltransferase/UDP-glucuronic acid dehydrogenase (UDP-4-keto-hexauronic acid decarboxylating)
VSPETDVNGRPRVALVAEEAAGLAALKLLLAAGLPPVMVLSDSPAGRGATVSDEARRLGLSLRDPALVGAPDFGEELREAGLDLLLNVHSLHVAAAETVAAPRLGAFNLHPGPLPEYAGLNAPSWAIYNGETRHAVTLHWMEPEVDAGAVAYAAEVPIEPDDTGLSLSAKCVRAGLPLIERLLADAGRGTVPRAEQDASRRRWYGAGPPHDGRLPWTLSARQIADLVRAADFSPLRSPWGHPGATLDGRELEIVRVTATGEVAYVPPGSIGPDCRVAAADEWLRVERLRVDGRSQDPAEVLEPGARFQLEQD